MRGEIVAIYKYVACTVREQLGLIHTSETGVRWTSGVGAKRHSETTRLRLCPQVTTKALSAAQWRKDSPRLTKISTWSKLTSLIVEAVSSPTWATRTRRINKGK
ncbi:hypothetical protein RRG08_039029 [Elysia crispata]|uniref:Uncharacterized protein n=1 Tax=Elysia crispata TaxID=231223 RepID=A0AAE1E636_9GAST|nr:hypothetical protein RRG08_039029 [Elysia crispata]